MYFEKNGQHSTLWIEKCQWNFPSRGSDYLRLGCTGHTMFWLTVILKPPVTRYSLLVVLMIHCGSFSLMMENVNLLNSWILRLWCLSCDLAQRHSQKWLILLTWWKQLFSIRTVRPFIRQVSMFTMKHMESCHSEVYLMLNHIHIHIYFVHRRKDSCSKTGAWYWSYYSMKKLNSN